VVAACAIVVFADRSQVVDSKDVEEMAEWLKEHTWKLL
jgi:hypothetical protein